MNLLDAIKLWKSAGGQVTLPRRTGEMIFSHPKMVAVCRINGRRKDVPMPLRVYMKRLGLWPRGERCA